MIDTIVRLVWRELREAGAIPYLAEVFSVGAGKVRIQALDEEDPAGTSYARVAGFSLDVGNTVIAIKVNGEPVVIGKVQADAPNPQDVEGGLNASNIFGHLQNDQIGNAEIDARNIADDAVEQRHIKGKSVGPGEIISVDPEQINGLIPDDKLPQILNHNFKVQGDFGVSGNLSFYNGTSRAQNPPLVNPTVTSGSFTADNFNAVRALANELRGVLAYYNLIPN